MNILPIERGTAILPGFSLEIMQARGEWSDIFKVLKEKKSQPRILYSMKLSFKSEREIKMSLVW